MNKNILVKSLLVCSMVAQLNAELLRDDATNIVTDTKTKLMWQDDVANLTSWKDAITTCENLTLGGYDDWRLPNIRELRSIVDISKYDPAISTVFTANVSGDYQSSTTGGATFPEHDWVVNFKDGIYGLISKVNNNFVRCVRAGQ